MLLCCQYTFPLQLVLLVLRPVADLFTCCCPLPLADDADSHWHSLLGFGSSSIGVSLPIHVMFVAAGFAHTQVGRCHLSFTFNSISFFILLQLTQFCSFNFCESTDFCCSTSTQCRFSRLGERGLTTQSLPTQDWTCLDKSRWSTVRTPLFASSLIIVASREFRICGFLSSAPQ